MRRGLPETGDILVTSSISGVIDIHWEPVYSASKHAVQSFVHSMRRQVASQGLRVMALSPGRVANELWGIHDPAEVQRHVDERISVTSENVVDAAIFMLSQPMNVTVRDLVMLPQAPPVFVCLHPQVHSPSCERQSPVVFIKVLLTLPLNVPSSCMEPNTLNGVSIS